MKGIMQTIQHGEKVVFLWNKRWQEGQFVAEYPEFKQARKVRRNDLDYIVESKDVKTWAEHEADLLEQQMAAAREQYADIIAAWASGKKTAKDIAASIGCAAITAHNRLMAAKRRGLV